MRSVFQAEFFLIYDNDYIEPCIPILRRQSAASSFHCSRKINFKEPGINSNFIFEKFENLQLGK